MDGRADGQTDERKDVWTDEWTDGPTDGRKDVWTDGRTDGPTDARTYGQTVGLTDGRTDERTDGRTNGRTDRRTAGRTDGQTDGRMDRRIEGRIFRAVKQMSRNNPTAVEKVQSMTNNLRQLSLHVCHCRYYHTFRRLHHHCRLEHRTAPTVLIYLYSA